MEEIAKRARVSTGSLYNYFRDKEELYERVVNEVDHALATDERYLQPAFDHAFDEDKSAVDALIDISARYLAFGVDHPGYFQLIAQPNLFGLVDEKLAQRMAKRVDDLVHRVAQVIDCGMKAGEITDRLDPDAPDDTLDPYDAARFLHGAWNGLLALSVREDDLKLDEDDLQKIALIAVNALRFGMEPRTLVLRSTDGRQVALGTTKELEDTLADISAATHRRGGTERWPSLRDLHTSRTLPADAATDLGRAAASLQKLCAAELTTQTNKLLERLATLAPQDH